MSSTPVATYMLRMSPCLPALAWSGIPLSRDLSLTRSHFGPILGEPSWSKPTKAGASGQGARAVQERRLWLCPILERSHCSVPAIGFGFLYQGATSNLKRTKFAGPGHQRGDESSGVRRLLHRPEEIDSDMAVTILDISNKQGVPRDDIFEVDAVKNTASLGHATALGIHAHYAAETTFDGMQLELTASCYVSGAAARQQAALLPRFASDRRVSSATRVLRDVLCAKEKIQDVPIRKLGDCFQEL
ncbi:uncharacterized protein LOC112349702 isoform X2 [Selaginella moellendorffii]|uniref:uncharacterized protein LOC112349702 isoform X2 n=1 Tax=Selaginella moellendorffii TaxID=88036 RepID=UPI000D1CD4BE|nr:uncharacterized protein LOC112349702 isoform X2 [Selaginella moellendorffii]|eukprot:XP_024540380.1 uncharacterized protein LOC112349702 isoform X2 [Selaginella moellendorffii]